jgi:ribosomal protein L7/L12
MTKVLISGWKIGFEKVQFTMLLRHGLGLSLSAAKDLTEAVLRHEAVELKIPEAQAELLLSEMSRLGAHCAATVAAR